MADPSWENVLVLQTSFIGDTVLTLPLLAEIKRRFPEGRLTFFCSPQGEQLARNWEVIDEVIVDDKKGRDRGWSGLRRQAQRLRERAFTLALTPHKSLRSALILSLAQIPCRVGFRQSKGWFLFHRLVDRPADRHDVERNLSLLNAFDIAAADCGRRLEMRERVCPTGTWTELMTIKKGGQGLLVGVNPGSVWPTKRWEAESFTRLIKLLKAQRRCEIVIFGGPDDVGLAGAIERGSESACTNLAGKFSLADLPDAVAACDIFITNDSGPMHIAVARGVPTVAIFCATTPSLGFYPYSSRAIVVQADLPCRPCSSHGGRRCPLGTADCIKRIRPEDVLRAVDRLLELKEDAGHGSERCEPEHLWV